MLIGLGFFTISMVWGIYNIAMPIYLDDLGLSGIAVGAVMTIDNIFAVIFLPIFGALSDRTNTRYGRRMPYLLVGVPLSALAFIHTGYYYFFSMTAAILSPVLFGFIKDILGDSFLSYTRA